MRSGAYQLLGPGAGRRISPFVGREGEVSILLDRLRRVRASREGQVVVLKGEAGAGKSRLLFELRRHLAGTDIRDLEGRCVSYGSGTPYSLFADVLRRAWALDPGERADAVESQVRRALATLAMEWESCAPCALAVLGVRSASLDGLSPETVRTRTFDALQRILRAYVTRGVALLVVEDLHWVDRTSDAFLTGFLDALPGLPLLVVVTTRPGYDAPWLARSFASQLALPPLAAGDSRLIAGAVLGGAQDDRVVDQIVTRADGNPFFIEELAWAATGTDGVAGAAVPATVNLALAARMDRLAAEPRRVLAVAAVLGREVELDLLAALTQTSREALVAPLRHLVDAEFFFEQPAGGVVFKHALTQEAAYERLAPADRDRLHRIAAETLAQQNAGRDDEIVDRLAYHYARTSDHAAAVRYLVRMAGRATATYALEEAVAALQSALAHAGRLPDEVARDHAAVRIVTDAALPLVLLGRIPEAMALLSRCAEAADRLDDDRPRGAYLFWVAHVANHLGQADVAARSAERALRCAESVGDRVTLGRTHYELALQAFWVGRVAECVAHAERGIALLEGQNDEFFRGVTGWILAFGAAQLGSLDTALHAARRTIAIGEQIADPRLQSYGLGALGWIRAARDGTDEGVDEARRAVDLTPDPLARAVVSAFLGGALLERGRPREAVAALSESVRDAAAMHIPYLSAWYGAWLSEAECKAGDVGRARERARQSLAAARASGFRWVEGLAQRTMGRAAHAGGAPEEARALIADAVEMFDGIGARYEAARARLQLAAVVRGCGDTDSADNHLREAQRGLKEIGVQRLEACVDATLPG